MTIAGALNFLGGIGLFLLGMRLMTDGLTTAAGDTLRVILGAATRSRLRAIFSGILITALVQSSSAVIFTTIGFVNASLLALPQAVGVTLGAQLGQDAFGIHQCLGTTKRNETDPRRLRGFSNSHAFQPLF